MPKIIKNGVTYIGTSDNAAAVSYDNTSSGLNATDVQGAIDEVVDNKMDKVNPTGTGSFSLNRKVNTTIGERSFAEGYNTTASGFGSHAEGQNTTASGRDAHAEGDSTTASDSYSHAEGFGTTASGGISHAEGLDTTASGYGSHAEGYYTTASDSYSHAEGYYSTTRSNYSHAEGFYSTASGLSSHAECRGTTASGVASHAEGAYTTASGDDSHTEGYYTIASGPYSHADGCYSTANHKSQHVFGEYNALDDSTAAANARGNYVEIVGNGNAEDRRSNARTLDWSGNEVLSGTIEATGFGTTLKQIVIDAIYPVGSIYMSVSSTNPGTTFGVGTWEAWGSGRVPVGVDSNDTSFDTVEETGGSKSNSYTPAGTNSGCAVTAHTYTPAGTNSGCAVTAHTYTPAGTIGNTTLTAAQSGMPKHRHSGTSLTASNTDIYGVVLLHGVSTSTGGLIGSRTGVFNPTDSTYRAPANHYKTQYDLTDHTGTNVKSYNGFELSASHSHSVTGNTGYADAQNASASHNHSWTGTKATLSHTVTQPTFSGTKATLSHTVTQPTFKGTAANISTVQPYITCYMWKRTA